MGWDELEASGNTQLIKLTLHLVGHLFPKSAGSLAFQVRVSDVGAPA